MKKRKKKKAMELNEKLETRREAPLDEEAPGEAAPEPESEDETIPEAEISEAGEGENVLSAAEAALEALERERDELKDQLLRARAEFDNYRKRMLREGEQLRKTAAQGLMRSLLPIVDNLERALSHADIKSDGFAQGVEMIVKQFSNVLADQGLEPIPSVGENFDPNVHEALTHQPSDQYPADTVMEEFQRGYRLGDYVLRPSQVVVSSGAPAPVTPLEPDEVRAGDAPGGGEP
ncbi:MAG: nucleotide exchange factor GrpE [Candidatus Hydrogenedentes bacterium]|nr:nucleotide exchange factor GrpE [Candidatus Hydrogenedentota bacterium]